MPTHSSTLERIKVTGTDMSDEGVFVQFSDGTAILFHSQFLYDVRDQDANIHIAEPEDDR